MKDKEVVALTRAFERMWKYYKGWVFAYEHPGVFCYHQMGGPLTIYFTPDFDKEGIVPIQISDDQGNTPKVEEVPYENPTHNGAPHEQIEAYHLFQIVRPYLEQNMDW